MAMLPMILLILLPMNPYNITNIVGDACNTVRVVLIDKKAAGQDQICLL